MIKLYLTKIIVEHNKLILYCTFEMSIKYHFIHRIFFFVDHILSYHLVLIYYIL